MKIAALVCWLFGHRTRGRLRFKIYAVATWCKRCDGFLSKKS